MSHENPNFQAQTENAPQRISLRCSTRISRLLSNGKFSYAKYSGRETQTRYPQSSRYIALVIIFTRAQSCERKRRDEISAPGN